MTASDKDVDTGPYATSAYYVDIDSDANSTAPNHTSLGTDPTRAAVIGTFSSFVILAAISGNILVIAAVISYRQLRTVTNYFVVSLSVADLTVAILVMPFSLLYEILGEWTLSWQYCYFWMSCDVTCCTASILHLCLIALDRYVAITEPLTYKSRMSQKRVYGMIAVAWACSIAISVVPIFMGWFADLDHVQLYVDSPECGLYVNRAYATVSSMTSFYVPLVIMVFIYFKIFRIAQRQAGELQKLERLFPQTSSGTNQRHNSNSRSPRPRDAKAIRTLGTLMGTFILCWLPFFLMYVVMAFCDTCYVPPVFVFIITWLGYVNSVLNPCIYAFLNKDFRNAFKRILCRRSLSVFMARTRKTPVRYSKKDPVTAQPFSPLEPPEHLLGDPDVAGIVGDYELCPCGSPKSAQLIDN